jgi:ketosteroid isomerase-like protein
MGISAILIPGVGGVAGERGDWQRINAAFNRGDLEAMFAYYHPDLEWRDLQHAPDAPERLRGISAVGAYLEQWQDAFDGFTAEIGEYVDAGACVLTTTHWRGKGKDSGVVIDLHTVDVIEIADGRVVRITMGYSTRDEALKAEGLKE